MYSVCLRAKAILTGTRPWRQRLDLATALRQRITARPRPLELGFQGLVLNCNCNVPRGIGFCARVVLNVEVLLGAASEARTVAPWRGQGSGDRVQMGPSALGSRGDGPERTAGS